MLHCAVLYVKTVALCLYYMPRHCTVLKLYLKFGSYRVVVITLRSVIYFKTNVNYIKFCLVSTFEITYLTLCSDVKVRCGSLNGSLVSN